MDVINELQKATGLGERTLYGIVNSGISEIQSPKKTRNRPKKYSFDSFDKQIIKEEIKKFYTEKTLPFLKDIYSRIPEIQNLGFKDCGITTFQKIMNKMGFKKKNVREISRRILIEKTENVIKRREYLRRKN